MFTTENAPLVYSISLIRGCMCSASLENFPEKKASIYSHNTSKSTNLMLQNRKGKGEMLFLWKTRCFEYLFEQELSDTPNNFRKKAFQIRFSYLFSKIAYTGVRCFHIGVLKVVSFSGMYYYIFKNEEKDIIENYSNCRDVLNQRHKQKCLKLVSRDEK